MQQTLKEKIGEIIDYRYHDVNDCSLMGFHTFPDSCNLTVCTHFKICTCGGSKDVKDAVDSIVSLFSSELENIFLEMEKVIKDFKLVTPEENEFEDLPRKMVFGSGQMNMQVRVLTRLKKLREDVLGKI